MPERIGIAGTPGTGKKTLAPLLATRLGLPALDLNVLALAGRARIRGETVEVDPVSLRGKLRKKGFDRGVAYGHLLPHVFKKGELDFVAVLRCDPKVLKGRLLARGYAPEKLRANLEAELIGVVLDGCIRRFGEARVFEYDTSREKQEGVTRRILSDLAAPGRRKRGWIDWTLLYSSPRRLRSLLSAESTESALT